MKNDIEMREGWGQPGQQLMTVTEKKYGELVRDEKFSLF
jgi:hypothetical protein